MYIILFPLFLLLVVFLIGVVFNKHPILVSPALFVIGIVLSLIPGFKIIQLNPELVLEVFLPLLIYETCVIFPWNQILINLQPIILLSLGHVVFITCLVALITHYFIPQFSWPIAFMFGAIISPPDHVAISTIAENNYLPRRLSSILQGEGMLNDAAALVIFKFSLASTFMSEFLISNIVLNFFEIIFFETIYGLLVGYVIGEIRLRLGENVKMHMIISFLTPFIAYLPPHSLGGSGVLATVVAGLYIGHSYLDRFPSAIRITGTGIWTTFGYIVPCVLFLMAGLEFKTLYVHISDIPIKMICFYMMLATFIITAGRFVWIFSGEYVPLFLISFFKKVQYPFWKYSFIASWSGMRGVISLAAALAIPYSLASEYHYQNSRDLVIFLVFGIVFITFIFQGLTLPFMIKLLGMKEYRGYEVSEEHFSELSAKIMISESVIKFLVKYRRLFLDPADKKIRNEIDFQIKRYRALTKKYMSIQSHLSTSMQKNSIGIDIEKVDIVLISKKIIDVEKRTLDELFYAGKIDAIVKKRLLHQIDHRTKHLLE